jgi:arginine exporter protein ArgO
MHETGADHAVSGQLSGGSKPGRAGNCRIGTVVVVIGAAVTAGVLAGLAIAVPLGAIGVLILQEGLTGGWRPAAAAATGVALVDFGYATVAAAAGTGVTALLAGRARVVQLVGAVVLLAVAARGLITLRRAAGPAPETWPVGGEPRGPDAGRAGAPVGRVLRRFVAMTAVNPLTAIYFVVLAAGLGATVAGWRAGSAFVVGVFVGSWAWQLVLAGIGTFAGARLPRWARTGTSVAGYLIVIGYALRLAVG